MTLPFWFAPRDPQYQWVFYLISDTDSQSCILAWPIRLRVSMFVDQAQGQLCFSHVKDVTTICSIWRFFAHDISVVMVMALSGGDDDNDKERMEHF